MTRKEKCTMLRLFLMNIAEKNHCIYLSSECNQECDGSGPCKKLHAELCSLLKALRYYGEDEPVTLSARSLYHHRFELSDPARFNPGCFVKCPEDAAEERWLANVIDGKEPYAQEKPDETPARATEELLASPVAELGLGVRACNAMMRYGTRTIGDLAQMSERDFMTVPGMTQSLYLKITNKLEPLGLYIHQDF